MNKKLISKDKIARLTASFISSVKEMGSRRKIIELVALFVLASILHELGHIIVGGGVQELRYPGPDMLSTVIIVRDGSTLSELSGLLFTLPLLLITTFPKLLLFLLLFQSR